MGAQLAATVYVTDPDTHQTVELAPGTCPEDRLARLVTNRAAWVDGKLPRLKQTGSDAGPTGGGQDDASGADSATGGDGDQTSGQDDGDSTDKAAPAAKKTAARKTAATGRSRGRDAADVGDSGE